MSASSCTSSRDLVVRDLGRMAYGSALALQRQLQQEVIQSREDYRGASCAGALGSLLLVEHDPPVITVSRRPDARRHLLAAPPQLAAAGVDVAETDRGGDITYHGPGQLVVYPILDLNRLGLRLAGYMRFLEQIVINVIGEFGIEGLRDETAIGVWVNVKSGADRAAPAKICALGVRISRWVSMHGLALNVSTNLDHFKLIVPCGLTGRPVTSMKQLLGDRCPDMPSVKAAMTSHFSMAVRSAASGTSA